MSNLTETLCLKVSKEMKDYLNELDNSSKYIRELISHDMIKSHYMEKHDNDSDLIREKFMELFERDIERLVDIVVKRV